MIRQEFVIQLEWSFLLIVVVSLIMNKINPKLTCLAYVVAVVYIIDWLLAWMGLKGDLFKIDYVKMIMLVGSLHGIEGILTFFLGGKSSYPIMAYRGKTVAGGYQACGRWLIPLLFFSINGIYVPIIAAVVYYNESFVLSPKEKAKKVGSLIGGFGILVILIARLVVRGDISLGVGVLSMPLLHEMLFILDTYIEEGSLKYPLPEKGIRVMEILGENTLGMSRGDIIKKLNEKEMIDEETYEEQLKLGGKFTIEIEKITGEQIDLVCKAEELKKMKLIFLPPY